MINIHSKTTRRYVIHISAICFEKRNKQNKDNDSTRTMKRYTQETLQIDRQRERERERRKKELFLINNFICSDAAHTHRRMSNKKVVILLNPNAKQIKWWWWTSKRKKSRNRQTWIEKKQFCSSYRQISITFIGSNTNTHIHSIYFICCCFHKCYKHDIIFLSFTRHVYARTHTLHRPMSLHCC